MQLAEFNEGDQIKVNCLIKSAKVKTTKNGSQYLALTFQDQSGELNGNLWDVTDQQVADLEAGKVVSLTGRRSSYQGNPQVEIQRVELKLELSPNDFVLRAPESDAEIKAALRPFFTAITEPKWHQIINGLISKHGESYFSSPAAKSNHHAFVAGLAYHTLSILRLAKAIIPLYPGINEQLVYAGAILHDLGKTIELSGPVATEYTVEGKLIGHISIVDGEITAICEELKIPTSSEAVVALRHLVLAHHGLLEYGSPVRPQVLEAELLHQLDELDASLLMMTSALAKVQPGEFTERLFAMDNRQFYKLKLP